jgi:hypothetical protein
MEMDPSVGRKLLLLHVLEGGVCPIDHSFHPNRLFRRDHDGKNKQTPLHWEMPPTLNGRLEIYAGVNDGYADSVPISHSILFFNKVARHFGKSSMLVNQDEMIQCLTRGIPEAESTKRIDGRAVLYSRDIEEVSLTVFDGGHEILPDHCLNRLIDIADNGKKGDILNDSPWQAKTTPVSDGPVPVNSHQPKDRMESFRPLTASQSPFGHRGKAISAIS